MARRLMLGCWWVVGIVVFSLSAFTGSTGTARADDRNLWWDRFDVRIYDINTTTNRFSVTETYEITVERGPYRFGLRTIPLNRVDSLALRSVQVDGQLLSRGCDEVPGTYCQIVEGSDLNITYYFWEPAESGATINITLSYMVFGGLRSYDTGDELHWIALPEDLSGFEARSSQVVVELPAGLGILSATGEPAAWELSRAEMPLTWVSPSNPSNYGAFEVRVTYPHNPLMPKPNWQAANDRRQWYTENLQPYVSVGLTALAGIIVVGGSLLVLPPDWRQRNSHTKTAAPDILTEPPGDLSPGLASTLIERKIGGKAIMGTVVDLAQRGYLVIEQTGKNVSFRKTYENAHGLAEHERLILAGIFGPQRQETTLAQLKTRFHERMPSIERSIWDALSRAGYFSLAPKKNALAELIPPSLVSLGIMGITATLMAFSYVSPCLTLPFIALIVVGILAWLNSGRKRTPTPSGAKLAAYWRAFQRYLAQPTVSVTTDRLEAYLPYAVAFGLGSDYMKHAASRLDTTPGWYRSAMLDDSWSDDLLQIFKLMSKIITTRPIGPGGSVTGGGGGFGGSGGGSAGFG